MALQIYIEDRSKALIYDPEQATERASNIRFESTSPKGYYTASFDIRRSDFLVEWPVKGAYGVVIQDGAKIVWQGRIKEIPRRRSGTDETVTIIATGWWVVFEERLIHKWWINHDVLNQLYQPTSLITNNMQNSWVVTRHKGHTIIFAGTTDISRTSDVDLYIEEYRCLSEDSIRRVTMNYKYRTGEGFRIRLYNVDQSTVEHLENLAAAAGGATGSIDDTLAAGDTDQLQFRVYAWATDVFDQNDYVVLHNIVVYHHYESGHTNYSSPSYTQGEIIEDIILLVNAQGDDISSDFDDIRDSGQVLNPFLLEEPVYANEAVNRVLDYADSDYRTWLLHIWDRTGTSDSLPKAELTYWNIEIADYIIDLRSDNVMEFSDTLTDDDLFNWTRVRYVDNRGFWQYLDGDDNSTLKDLTSIADEGQRGYYRNIGQGTSITAAEVGSRIVQIRKDRKRKGNYVVQGYILDTDGHQVPVSWVRAGSRILVRPFDEIMFVRHASYDDNTKTVTITPDIPRDNVSRLLAAVKRAQR